MLQAGTAAIGVFFSALLLLLAVGDRSRRSLRDRAADLGRRRGEISQSLPSLRRSNATKLDRLARRMLPQPMRMRDRLRQTGKDISLGAFGLATGGTIMLLVVTLWMLDVPLFEALPGGAFLGMILPRLVVSRLIARRRARFAALFPEAIGLIIRGLKSGLPASESMMIVGKEIAEPVGGEFRRITDDMRLGTPIEQAMGDAGKRINVTEFDFFITSIGIQRETGGNLTETLQNLDEILRRRRQMRLKVRAMSSEARTSAAIIGALPLVMIAILFAVNPHYPSVLFTTGLGRVMLGAAMTSMGIGFFVISRMVKFEI